jgi:hypothetical protein
MLKQWLTARTLFPMLYFEISLSHAAVHGRVTVHINHKQVPLSVVVEVKQI